MTHRFFTWAMVALLLISSTGYAAGIKEKQLDPLYTAEVFKRDGSVTATGDFDLAGSYKITNLAEGTDPGDAVTLSQLSAAAAGLDPKESVRAATTGLLDADTEISGSPTYDNDGGTSLRGRITANLVATATLSIDGVALTTGDRILIKDEVDGTGLGLDANGIYTVSFLNATVVLDRALDFDEDDEVSAGAYTFVEEGGQAGTGLVLVSPNPVTIGGASGSDINFTVFITIGLASSGITGVDAGDAGSAGSAGTAARGDHEHAVSTAAPVGQSPDQTNAEGDDTTLARSDHVHSIPASAAVTLTPDAASAEGSGSSFARDDHIHGIVAAAPTSIAPDDSSAEGNASSFSRSNHVHGITAAVAGSISPDDSAAEGDDTSFARSDHVHGITAGTAVEVGTANAEGNSSDFARANHVHDSGVAVTSNKDTAPSATSGDDADTGLTIAATPALDSFVTVVINGVQYSVGDGVDTKCSYFADPGAPTTPKAIAAIAASDKLIWNGTTCGFDLETTDRVSLFYESF